MDHRLFYCDAMHFWKQNYTNRSLDMRSLFCLTMKRATKNIYMCLKIAHKIYSRHMSLLSWRLHIEDGFRMLPKIDLVMFFCGRERHRQSKSWIVALVSDFHRIEVGKTAWKKGNEGEKRRKRMKIIHVDEKMEEHSSYWERKLRSDYFSLVTDCNLLSDAKQLIHHFIHSFIFLSQQSVFQSLMETHFHFSFAFMVSQMEFIRWFRQLCILSTIGADLLFSSL